MKPLIVFDSYRTLIFKRGLDRLVQQFFAAHRKIKIPLSYINQTYQVLYERHKLTHPRWSSEAERRKYYRNYNGELAATLGFQISETEADALNDLLKKSSWAVYPDVKKTLQKLQRDGYALGVLSNWAADTLEGILEKLGIKKFFRFIYSSHDLKLDKPDPRIFTAVFRKQRSKYSKIYYVGDDYETDILPARKAGLEAILIDRPSYYPAKIDGVKIKSLEQIEKLLD